MERSKEARDIQKSLDVQEDKLKTVMCITAELFSHALVPWASGQESGEGLRTVLQLLDAGEEGWWSMRARFGWLREFVRRYEHHLLYYEDSLAHVALEGIGQAKDSKVDERAKRMMSDVWAKIVQ